MEGGTAYRVGATVEGGRLWKGALPIGWGRLWKGALPIGWGRLQQASDFSRRLIAACPVSHAVLCIPIDHSYHPGMVYMYSWRNIDKLGPYYTKRPCLHNGP